MKLIFQKNIQFLRLSSFLNKSNICRNCSNDANVVQKPVSLSYLKIVKSDPNETKELPIFVFHGLFGSKKNWRSLMNQISSKTKQIGYTFDLRNHGESPHTDFMETINPLDEMANDIKFFMDTNKINKADLIGHSLGGRVIAKFAYNWPDKVNKLLMVDISPLSTLPKTDFINKELFAILENSVETLPSNVKSLSDARKIVKDILMNHIKNNFIVDFFLLNLHKDESDGRIKWQFNLNALKQLALKHLFEYDYDAHQQFTGKSMIIYGQQSEYVKPEQINEIRKYLPCVKMIEIPDTGHYLHIEKSQEFINHTVEFLNS